VSGQLTLRSLHTKATVERKRIALALEYPLMQQGGTEVLVRELLRGLSRHFEVVLVSGERNKAELPDELGKLISSHIPWQKRTASSATARALAARLCQENIALAHFHLGGTYEWGSNRPGRCPIDYLSREGVLCLTTNHLVVEWLNCGVHPERPFLYKLLAQLFAWFNRARIYGRTQLEVCVSKHDRARLVRMFPIFRHKIHQRYHSLLPASAPPPDLHRRARTVLCVGTIGGRKAQPHLVEAFGRVAKSHPQWELDLVGRVDVPTDVERIKDCIARHHLNGRVHLSGWLSDEETRQRMQTASIFAIPSLQEGLGLSLQEALFHGCVGVGTRAGGIPELIEHEINGLLVPPGDIEALRGALERLMSDTGLLEKLRTQSRPSITRKRMTADGMIESYLELYRGLLSATRPQPQGAGIEAPGP